MITCYTGDAFRVFDDRPVLDVQAASTERGTTDEETLQNARAVGRYRIAGLAEGVGKHLPVLGELAAERMRENCAVVDSLR